MTQGRHLPNPEPDWRAVFREECARHPHLPNYLQEAEAFEATLRLWRREHCTGTEPGKRIPAPAVHGIIALAELGVMAPRSEWRDVPRETHGGYQHDEHCWMEVDGSPWRIVGGGGLMLALEKMTFEFDGEPERRWRIDNSKIVNTSYTQEELDASLAARRKKQLGEELAKLYGFDVEPP